ncbi:hypothetical protein [Curtobacterium sp. MCSS17_016]|uniref:hypothetical protein n=1 Tax=Curtobacterium sp. MCSS17_016 TaxID=2175644 RepID=UPI000DA80282|nr:hypothetical protein [Curtobacterium sp. MCSS17_016]WIE81240.1 hypothetical protein DEJ19_018575 [Curtobacterium sp. MCSS17_016]
MPHLIAVTDATRERLAAGLYAKYRLRSPGTLTWETEPDHYKERFYAQADDALDVLGSESSSAEATTLSAIKERLTSGASYNLGSDIAAIIAEHEGTEPTCGMDGPHGWVCDEPADHEPANLHAAKHGGAWKGGAHPGRR